VRIGHAPRIIDAEKIRLHCCMRPLNGFTIPIVIEFLERPDDGGFGKYDAQDFAALRSVTTSAPGD
jgi:hypothetical protein